MQELYDGTDAVGLAEAVRRGDVTAAEVVALALARIAERNPELNAVTEVAAAPTGGDGPLAGVPFVIKDLKTDVAGLRSTSGSRLWADNVAAADSEIVARYRRAGLVVVATTSSPEWGFSPSTEPLLHGPTRNPHRTTHSPGGSSGGSAAAVAGGMVPAGHASDGGGSIRIPAAACGLVGLKPSRGRTPTYPRRSAFSYPVGVHHAVTRSVRDSAALLDAVAGPMPGDPFTAPPPLRPYVEEVGVPPGRLRIALSTTRPDGGPVHGDCVAAAEAAAKQLEALGHDVVPATPAYDVEAQATAMRLFMSVPFVVAVDARLTELGRELRDDDLEPFSRVMYDMGRAVSGTELSLAGQGLERAAQAIGPFFERYDLLLTPTLAAPTPELGWVDTSDLDSMFTRAGTYGSFTGFANVTGQPAISLPLATDATGLPLGVQLVAAYGREDLLVRVAAQVEAAHPWPTNPVWPPG